MNWPRIVLAGKLRHSLWSVLLVGFLVGCAGTEKLGPADLGPNTALLGVRQAWSAGLGSIGFPLDLKVVGNQVVAADSSGIVVAIDAQTGRDLWRVNLNTPIAAGIGFDGRFAAVVTLENELVVIDTGKELWRQRLSATTITAPLVAGARVFSLSADRTVAGFDLNSGRKLWQQQRSGDQLVLGQPGLIYPVGDTLAVGFGGRLLGLNPLNGNVRWDVAVANARGTNEVERLVDLVAGVSRVGESSCVRAFQSVVACVNTTRGSVEWTKPANGNAGLHGDASLIVGTESDGKVVAWKRIDGERLWLTERLRFRGVGAPLLLGRSVVVGDQTGLVHFLSREDGSPLARVPTDGSSIIGAPVLSGQTLIVSTRRGGIFGFRPE